MPNSVVALAYPVHNMWTNCVLVCAKRVWFSVAHCVQINRGSTLCVNIVNFTHKIHFLSHSKSTTKCSALLHISTLFSTLSTGLIITMIIYIIKGGRI